MGQAFRDEATVSRRRGVAEGVFLDNDHVALGLSCFGEYRRP
jgi:hypothetical protein